ncbi:arachidonate 12-lipoxygenase, 12S-type [Danio rerio]|uniref:Arachidonate 12-lipoxygenase n=1 Tax=Danio rerio TaxID=7955 RepID=Q7T2A9_DANRE|nr:arachidonate 12-lipoxygenase, 12S-type [Danio rerio]AAH54621.1 Arachidonate 12-lipoxygenase [Danio rerio]|eukprot:NP_955912.1 arachidonate 15-lipoxygenase [Danio rerio]
MEYKVTVATGTSEYSGTNNYVYVTLIGEKGKSERTLLDNPGLDFCRGAVDDYIVKSDTDLGPLILVRLEKHKYFIEDNWFCRYVKVSVPGERCCYTFPCYRWLVGDGVFVELREGTAKKLSEDSLPLEMAHRQSELQERQKTYRWVAWAPGIPKCIDAKSEADLPQDARFDNEKRSDFEGSLHYALLELSLKKLAIRFGKSWSDLEDFRRIFWKLRSPIAEYTMEHWKEDWFFAYQFLNGSNPRNITRLKKVPSNFLVTGDMVQSSLIPTTTLNEELKKGNIFLVDHAILDGIPANVIRNSPQYIAAPLCLLYEHPEKGLIPIAIQLEQKPDKDTPVFLPSDPPLAWLLAKMWVRHAEFQVFQLLSHLLRTHLMVEVICVATLRQLPAVHPIYKLLTPHLRYTLEINCRGRTQLLSPEGIFKRVVSTGGEGLLILAQREYKVLTYRSLQPKFDFLDRGVTKVKGYVYRDYSLMLWDVIQNFVSGIVSLYYQCDSDVQEDSELQAWIHDVAVEGFVDVPEFGLASDMKTKEELITLLSVAIFTSTAQHAATNNGQFDWCAWVPNTPCTMRHPPPRDKDAVTMEMIMDTLPDISQSCVQMAITWHLGRAQPDAIPMGQYVEQYFTEPAALKVIDKFRKELKELEDKIMAQNEGLELQYLYLCPSRMENSITI